MLICSFYWCKQSNFHLMQKMQIRLLLDANKILNEDYANRKAKYLFKIMRCVCFLKLDQRKEKLQTRRLFIYILKWDKK